MVSLTMIFITLISSLITSSPVQTYAANETDKLTLLAFKSLITEDPLSALVSWNNSNNNNNNNSIMSDFCNWTGVECDPTIRRVVGLNLTGQNLAGIITPFIGNLTFMEILDLSGNSFQGEIPSEIGNLESLQTLNVSNNRLRGQIPGSLSNCTNLRNLALDHNFLTGAVPPELGLLPELETLYLGSNNLTGNLPSSIGNLTLLLEMDMSYNYLTGEFPATFSRLTRLRTFRFSVNYLSGEFPPFLYNLTSLEFLALSFNNLTGDLRDDIGLALPNLRIIWLAYNYLTGPIPDSFSNASNLENIDLLRNNFTGRVPLSFSKLNLLSLSIGNNLLGLGWPDNLDFITSLTNCTNLRFLNFGSNQFDGILPASFSNLSTQLTTLYLQGNSIRGPIPRDISNLVSLNTLFMNSNFLNGTIPNSFGMMPNLARVVLGSNRLTGQIPSSIGNMTSLMVLFLFDNQLEGEIPPSLANCQQLIYIWIAQNNLTGNIPREIIGITTLLSFNVSYNLLSGPVPGDVGNVSGLIEIDLSHNNFSGEIPDSLGNCLSLDIIFLHDNSFIGRIPNLARLSSLLYLDLSVNNLSGNIPNFLTRLPSFLTLNLSYNNLEGQIPLTGVFLNSTAVDIRGNRNLCGGISDFHFPPCINREPRNIRQNRGLTRKLKLVLIIVVTASFFAICLFLLVFCYIKRRLGKRHPLSSRSLEFHPKLSYEELLNATNGFSPQNLIGSGGFGRVYKGTLNSDRTPVAIKVLNLGQTGAAKSFLSECQALRNVRHHNLVKVITSCSSTDFQGNDFKALVYEYMPGGSLEERLHVDDEDCRLSVVKRIDIAVDVAAALHYLHHQCATPVVHCDLKPGNVLLDGDLRARVGDFGLARLVPKFTQENGGEQFSSVGVKGTIGYAAPEQGFGARRSILGDVYSYGILLLEMFTEKRPTDELFTGNLSLHSFVKMSIPDRVTEILDKTALCRAETWDQAWTCLNDKQRLSLIRLLQIGVLCSSVSPKDRMSMRQVYPELEMIRDSFLDAGSVKETSSSNRDVVHVEQV